MASSGRWKWENLSGAGLSFTKFTSLRSLRIADIILMGFPDGSLSSRPRYKWTTFKPRHSLSSLLPPSIEALYLNGELTRLSDDTGFLRDFAKDVAQFPLLRKMGTEGWGRGSFEKVTVELSKHNIEFILE